jgi:hypothetical protein
MWQRIGIEGESKWITSEESSDSSNHSLLMIDANSLRCFYKKNPQKDLKISQNIYDDSMVF